MTTEISAPRQEVHQRHSGELLNPSELSFEISNAFVTQILRLSQLFHFPSRRQDLILQVGLLTTEAPRGSSEIVDLIL
ncbi:hypothetical protein PF007_g11208 [Phytophthora fragariae]|uniref:Uncharacterized protein n=1 Tax=Phytophthora fragariae TaxID=53985 RepID=A0A6A3S8Z5_9STRA|nr:hypothetical protein PF003_g5501 [Phytophthora fragariae]KAE9112148.1 hypothetical protein PF007_g11208 [Phytophthora fragariae]KAE9240482.1 hypothetical protein PF004_g7487 [Phytophthora fragariae]